MAGTTRLVAKITNNNGRLSSAAPITLKNQIQEIRSIEDIGDVDDINVATGSTLVYNSTTDKYEIKMLDLDGGTF